MRPARAAQDCSDAYLDCRPLSPEAGAGAPTPPQNGAGVGVGMDVGRKPDLQAVLEMFCKDFL